MEAITYENLFKIFPCSLAARVNTHYKRMSAKQIISMDDVIH